MSPTPPSRPQLSLAAMFGCLTLAGIWCAVMGQFGIAGVVLLGPFILITAIVEALVFGWNWRYLLGYSIVGLLLGLLVFLPEMTKLRSGGNTAGQCRNQLKQIAIALENYESTHGCFPPLVMKSPTGRPLHSWRTLLLSDQAPRLAELYDLNEPWDGPTNARLHRESFRLFRCPRDTGIVVKGRAASESVSYLAIAVPGAQPGERFAVIEVHHSGIRWFEPRDITIDELLGPDSPLRKRGMPHGDNAYLNLALPDGLVERVTLEELPEKLANLWKEE